MVDSSTPTKVCTKCGIEQSITVFRKDPECRGGHKNRCRACDRLYEGARYQDPEIRARKLRQMRERRAANPEKFRERNRRNYRNEPEKYRREGKRWRDSRNDEARLLQRERVRRHKYVQESGRSAEPVDYAAILIRDGYICHICKQAIEPAVIANVHFDHVIPASKGGTHTSENVAISHKGCNVRKRGKIL